MGGLFSTLPDEEQIDSFEPKYNQRDYKKRRPGKNIYKIDDNSVYWRGDRVDGVNGKEFVDLGQGYGKDDHYIFYIGIKIAKVSTNFRVLCKGFAKDTVNVYYRGQQIPKADARTFKVGIDGTAKDKSSYYKHGKKIGSKRSRRK